MAKDTKLADISDMCENFTGADLKALLYNAQLAAIHRNTSNSHLYKGLFNQDSERGDDENDSLQNKDIKEKVVYIPNLVKGPVHVSSDELTKLYSEVSEISVSLRQQPSLFAARNVLPTSLAGKSEKRRLFSQAKYPCSYFLNEKIIGEYFCFSL